MPDSRRRRRAGLGAPLEQESTTMTPTLSRARPLATITLLLATLACAPVGDGADVGLPTVEYPEVTRGDVVDDYHGTSVADPYRWLEDLDSEPVAEFIRAQNDVSLPVLGGLAARDRLEERLTELWNFERYGTPFKEGGVYFWSRNDGLQDQDVWYMASSLEGDPEVLVDPNTFSEDGTVSLAGLSVSPDASLAAYGKSDGGSDWRAWSIRDLETGEDLDETIRYTKFTPVSWSGDGEGFYYSRYPVGEDGEPDGSAAVSVHYHRVGTSQEEDELVYSIPEEPEWNPYGVVTDDGRYLILNISHGYITNAVYYRDLEAGGEVVKLLDEWDALYDFLGNDDTTFYFQTNLEAPNDRVIAIDVTAPERDAWREVVPESEDALQGASLVGGQLVAVYLEDARSAVKVYDLDGEHARDVGLPDIGSVGGFGGELDDPETFYGFTNFTTPGAIYRYDVSTGESTLFRRAEVDVDADRWVTEQVFFTSADGTRVPMFIVHGRDLELDGDNPTLLYGYGGFDISLTPSFSVARMVWLEQGGVVAIPNLRGGGEYGKDWHLAGTKENKQNVFDDFIAAAEYLIAEGYTSTPRLVIQGGSNGGLLVGAAMTQRPDLFGAALPSVGVLDMLRYHTASANARNWQTDYGLSENPEEFEAQLAYSPVHNVQEGTCYPPTLITTADHDDRVVPWHSFKFAAALQHAQSCDDPILLRVETRAGHGAGKPTWMQIEEIADQWAFALTALRMEAAGGGGTTD
ncbi:MAG: prolyl oligopeptidase family serine peptidase [Acidobacteriota bacterium]